MTAKWRKPQSLSRERVRPLETPHRTAARRLARELVHATPEAAARYRQLDEAGFRQPLETAERVRHLATLVSEEELAQLLEGALDSCHPDLAIRRVEPLVESHQRHGIPARWPREEELRGLLRVLAYSGVLSDRIAQDPGLVEAFGLRPDAFDDTALRREAVARLVDAADLEAGLADLKTWRRRRRLAIAHFDLGEVIPPADLYLLTSYLADACIEAVWQSVAATLRGAGRGPPEGAAFTVLALGKLGGIELNFSSDVDLLFLWEAPRGPALEAQTRFDELGRRMIRLLSHRDAHGQLERVDLRLRPEGSSGPLTRSLDSALRYYRELGRPWERQMLIKARPVAGDLELGRRFVEQVRPFLVGDSLDLDSIDQLKELRRAAEQRSGRPASPRLDVKHGPGGIRDVETIVQFLQLLHASRHPTVVHPNTVQTLQRLLRVGALTAAEAAALEDCYLFLRKVENRVQMAYEVATHRLPADPEELGRLARSLVSDAAGDPTQTFLTRLDEARGVVRSTYSRLLTERFQTRERRAREVHDLVLSSSAAPHADAALAAFGFQEPAAARRALLDLARPGSRFLPARAATRTLLAELAPRLLERLSRCPDPDLALHHLGRVAARFRGRDSFLHTLAEQEAFLDLLVDCGSHSPFLTDILVRDPDALDSFIDALLVESRGERWRRRRIELEVLRRSRQPLLVLNEYKALELLRIGLRDIQGKAAMVETFHSLSRLAYHLTRRLLEWLFVERSDHVPGTPLRGFAVLAVGKLGGLEINYASDLDVLFLAEGDEAALARSTEVARELIRAAGQWTRVGLLYRLDTRLRPEGSSGPLVPSWTGFEQYYRSERAALFELQALLKGSFLAGDRALARRALELVRQRAVTLGQGDPGPALAEMRERLEHGTSERDLKRGVGGLLDAEFLVQFLQLRHGGTRPDVLRPGLLRALRSLRLAGVLPEEAARTIRDSYLLLRRVESRLQLYSGREQHELPDVEDVQAGERLARCCGFANAAALEAAVAAARERLRDQYRRVLGTSA